MSTTDLETELARWRSRGKDVPRSNARRLTVPEALAYRDAGNLPDELGRSLRLVLVVRDSEDLRSLGARRAVFEPDYHDAPAWRRPGSRPVNVVPLRTPGVAGDPSPWWETADISDLEAEWARTGGVGGMRVPGEYRSFVFKTVIALREAGLPVDPDSVGDSIRRWLAPEQAEEIRAALRDANP